MNHQTDQAKLRRLQNRIRARKGLIGCGEEFSVALHHSGKLVYAGTDRWGQEEARSWSEVMFFACGGDHIVALTEDGTLRVSGQNRVERAFADGQSCVRTVAISEQNLAVLLSNGRTIVGGDNRFGQCNTREWPTVADIVCGKTFTAGLTTSGTVVMTGGSRIIRSFVRSWRQIAGIFADYEGKHLYGITADGKLLSTAHLPRQVQKWKNLLYVAASDKQIWAVTATGQLLSTQAGVSAMSQAKHYIACAVSPTHTLTLTRDGQVLPCGKNDFGQCSTARFGALFSGFDEFSADRRMKNAGMDAADHEYQTHLVEASRYKRLLTCGERITACISADGRVLTSAGFRKSKQWGQVRALACGNAHLLALHENGRVSADGNDIDGCTAVDQWRAIKSIAAGKYHSLGLGEDGSVHFCGRNDKGQGDVTEWTGVRRIYAADDYTVGVTYDGRILVAGLPPFDPAIITDSWKNPLDVVLTSTHMACLYAGGYVYDTYGQLTDEDNMRTCDWQNVRSIAAGVGITVGLCYGGRVLIADSREQGTCRTADWKHVVDIACGDGYAVGLCADGRVLFTGSVFTTLDESSVSEIHHWQDIMAMQCGPRHLVGLTRNGQVLACGADGDKQCSSTAHFVLFRDVRQLYGYGQYGRQIEMEIQANRAAEQIREESKHRTAFADPTEAAGVLRGTFAIGMAHTICLDEAGHVHIQGANDCGQCDMATFETISRVAAGPYRSAAILNDGRILLAGRNSDGQGDARTLNRELDTVDAALAYTWKQVACGHTHTVALRSDGRVYAVGANSDGRCDTRQWRNVTDVACGIRHTVACRADGTCIATGENRYGQCEVSDWHNVSMVAAGEFHSVGLTSDGRLMAVGDNRKGQCAVEDLRNVIAVACLPEATLCVLADGRAVIRGGSGELNRAVEGLRHIAAVATCEHRIAAMTMDRELILLP